MTQLPRSLSAFYFLAGLLVGLLIGLSINRGWSDIATKFISAGLIIVFAFFWRQIESFAHRRYMETWSVRRTLGKWCFITTQYVLLRGTVLLLAVAAPMLPSLIVTTFTLMIILACVITLALLLMYLGHESWTECEQEYAVQLLRQTAEQTRIATN